MAKKKYNNPGDPEKDKKKAAKQQEKDDKRSTKTAKKFFEKKLKEGDDLSEIDPSQFPEETWKVGFEEAMDKQAKKDNRGQGLKNILEKGKDKAKDVAEKGKEKFGDIKEKIGKDDPMDEFGQFLSGEMGAGPIKDFVKEKGYTAKDINKYMKKNYGSNPNLSDEDLQFNSTFDSDPLQGTGWSKAMYEANSKVKKYWDDNPSLVEQGQQRMEQYGDAPEKGLKSILNKGKEKAKDIIEKGKDKIEDIKENIDEKRDNIGSVNDALNQDNNVGAGADMQGMPPEQSPTEQTTTTPQGYSESAVGTKLAENIQSQSIADMTASPEDRQGNEFLAPKEDLDAANQVDAVVQDEMDQVNNAKSTVLQEGLDVSEGVDPSDPTTQMTTDDVLGTTETIVEEVASGNRDVKSAKKDVKRVLSTPIRHTEPAIEKMGLEQYYPEINRPLQVGTYSGSIVGSNPIFTGGGGYFPMGIVDARKRAFERVKKEKIKKRQEITNLAMSMSNAALPYRDLANDKAFGIISRYNELLGGDLSRLEDDPNMLNDMMYELSQLKVVADKTIFVDDAFKQVAKDRATGTKYIPPYMDRAEKEYYEARDGLKNFEDNEYIYKAADQYRSFKQWTGDIDNYVKTQLSGGNGLDEGFWNLKEGVTTQEYLEARNLIEDDNYDELWSLYVKYFDPTRMQGAIDGLVNQNDYYMGENDKESKEILDAMGAYFLSQMPTKIGLNQKIVQHNEDKEKKRMALKWKKYNDAKMKATYFTTANNEFETPQTKELLFNSLDSPEAFTANFANNMGAKYNPNKGTYDLYVDQNNVEYGINMVTFRLDDKKYSIGKIRKMLEDGAFDDRPVVKEAAEYLSTLSSVNGVTSVAHPYPAMYGEDGTFYNIDPKHGNTGKKPSSADQMKLGVELESSIVAPTQSKTKWSYVGADGETYIVNTQQEAFSQSGIETGSIKQVTVSGGQEVMPQMPFTISVDLDMSNPKNRGIADQLHGAGTQMTSGLYQGSSDLGETDYINFSDDENLDKPYSFDE